MRLLFGKKKKHLKILTKSRFLHGLQCPLLLWTEIYHPGKIPRHSELTKTMFDAGNMVGKFAQKLFPSGISLPYLKFEDNIRSTRKALRKRKPLFEAGIMAKRLFSRVDILEPAGMFSWNIVEVKSSSSVKGINIQDVAFQLNCAKKAGIRIKKCYLMHINTSYVRHGEPDPKKLFVKVDITEAVRGCERGLTRRVEGLLGVIDSTEPPKQDIGEWCDSPYQCELTEDCWNFLPDHSIFELYSFGRKAFDLYRKGILSIKDISKDHRLNHKQEIQRKSVVENTCHADKEAVKRFLSKLEYPLHFMDFETVNPPIPLYDGTRPFQQIPFQFALYVIEKKGAKPQSLSFLADGAKDPRREFIEELKKGLGAKGSVICYNMMFENKIVREISHLYPEYRAWAEDVVGRTVDLLAPFKDFECYHPKQAGSASLKSVLPALTGMSYKQLNIAGGGEASAEFLKILHGRVSDEEKFKIRANLIEYCGLDARGMHHIVDELEKMTEDKA